MLHPRWWWRWCFTFVWFTDSFLDCCVRPRKERQKENCYYAAANAARCQLAQIKNHCVRQRRQRSRICSPASLPAFCLKHGRLLSCVIVHLLMRFPSKSSTLKHREQCAQMLGYEKSVSTCKRCLILMQREQKKSWCMQPHPSDTTVCINHA